MSTILKALRRLEEEEEGKRPARAEAPANGLDPKALSTDALRDGILAEEAAAEAASPAAGAPPRKRSWVLAALAAGSLALVALGYGLSQRAETPSETALAEAVRANEPADSGPRVGPPVRRDRGAGTASDALPGDPIAARRPPQPESIVPRPVPQPRNTAVPEATSAPEAISGLALAEVRPTQSAQQPIVIPPKAAPAKSPPAKTAPAKTPSIKIPGATKASPPAIRAKTPPAVAEQTVAKAPVRTVPAIREAPAPRTPRPRDRPGIEAPAPVAAEREPELPPIQKTVPIREAPRSTNRPVPQDDPPVREAVRQRFGDVRVQQTSWHPKSDRRSAKVRVGSAGETLSVSEGDAVGGMVVREITPSSVLFEAGGVEVRRRVGEGG